MLEVGADRRKFALLDKICKFVRHFSLAHVLPRLHITPWGDGRKFGTGL